jgi:ATP-dependent RNA helicase RhlE
MSYNNRSARGRSRRPRTNYYRGKGTTQNINPDRYIKVATGAEQKAYEPANKFADFPIDQRIKDNLEFKGYETPTPIQDQALVPAFQGKDVIGIAGTGTGKTTAFALPLIQKLIIDKQSAALIIAPTRELAQQIEQEVVSLANGYNFGTTLIIGGVRMNGQLRGLQRNPRIVIGTPGRLKDHIQRRSLRLQHFNTVVLDEVDRMLDMGFVKDVTDILSEMSTPRQSLFFSATLDSSVKNIVQRFTKEPVFISLKTESASENVHQDVVRYRGNMNKIGILHDILIKTEVSKVIVFDETKRGVEKLNKELIVRGFSADALHGGKSQGQRQRALSKFKKNEISILVATDVAARGIDVDNVSHVINYSVPKVYDDYIHRVGRAGRAGKTGYAITFVSH